MKTYQYMNYGGPEVLAHAERSAPLREPGRALVRVAAASLNPLDIKIRSGSFRLLTGRRFPRGIGVDFSGVVEQPAGSFRALDRVYGVLSPLKDRQGSLTEHILVDPGKLRRVPEGMSAEQAAALPVAALTALNGLRKAGDLKGKRVLVNGATGGVGHFAVQIAVAAGAVVTAVTSIRNMDLARELGAEEVLDYADSARFDRRPKFDVVFDAAARLSVSGAWALLNPGGLFLTTLYTPRIIVPAILRRLFSGRRAAAANMRDHPEDYARIEELFARGVLRPLIEQTYPLDRAEEAIAVLESGKVRGKVIVLI